MGSLLTRFYKTHFKVCCKLLQAYSGINSSHVSMNRMKKSLAAGTQYQTAGIKYEAGQIQLSQQAT
jgi:hypothetical protein